MRYALQDFGQDLLQELEQGFNVVRLSRWAMRLYSDPDRDHNDAVDDAVMEVVVMEEGPEFEMSEQELRDFAERLVK